MSEATPRDPLKFGRRELAASQFIPYVRHIDATTIALDGGALLSILELDGLPFETADVRDVNAHHRGLNTLWKNVADDSTMLWSIVIRRRTSGYPQGQFETAFSQGLDDRYRERMDGEDLYSNQLYLAVLRQPGVDFLPATPRFARRKASATPDADHLKKHRDTVLALCAGLEPIGARILGLVEHVTWSIGFLPITGMA